MVFDSVQNWVISISLSFILRFVAFSYSVAIPMYDVLSLDTQHIAKKQYMQMFFLPCSWIFALSPVKIAKKTHTYISAHEKQSQSDTHVHTLANTIFHVSLGRITSICFRKLLVEPIFFSLTLSPFFSLLFFVILLLLLVERMSVSSVCKCVFIDSSSSLMDD